MPARHLARLALFALCGMVLLGAGLAIWLHVTGVEVMRPLVIRSLEQVTGRDVTITGTFDLQLSLTPTLVAEGISVANAPWGTRESMVEIARAEFRVALWPLLRRRELHLERMRLIQPNILLETASKDRANWRFHETDPRVPDGPSGRFLLEQVEIADGTITWHDMESGGRQVAAVERFGWTSDSVTSRLSISGRGDFQSLPFEVDGTIGSIANLLRAGDPYPVDVSASLGDIAAAVKGRLAESSEEEDALRISIHGPRITTIGRLAGIDLPQLGPYQIDGLLKDAGDGRVAIDRLHGQVGTPKTIMAQAEGTIADLLSAGGIQLKVSGHGDDLRASAANLGVQIPLSGPFQASGTVTGEASALTLTGLTASVDSAGGQLRLSGDIKDLVSFDGLSLLLSGKGNDMSGLFAGPPGDNGGMSPFPFDLQVRIGGGGRSYELRDLRFEFAESDIGGQLSITQTKGVESLRVGGELTSQRLDIASLAGNAADPGVDPVPGATDSARLFGDAALPFSVLDHVDGTLRYSARTLDLGGAAPSDLALTASLDDGRLVLNPISFRLAGGSVSGEVTVDASQSPPTILVNMTARAVRLADLLSDWPLGEQLVGQMALRLDLRMAGESLGDLMAGMDGTGSIAIDGGRLLDTQLNLLVADLDLLNLLPLFRRDKGYVDINCFVGHFKVVNGRVASDLLLDTDRMTIAGEGTILLDKESINLELVPEAKSSKLSAIAVPIDIQGPLSRPSVTPRKGVALGQAALGALGGLLVPLNLFAGILGGGQDEGQCVKALRDAATSDQPIRREK